MMIIYIARTLLGNVALLADPQKISTTTIIIYLLLAIFFGFGYSYNIIYNIVYGHCDKLVESTNRAGLMIDQIYNGLMIVYAIVSSIYLYQRISAVLFVKSIVYKSYLGQPDILKRISQSKGANSSALLKFIPCLKKLPHFTCHPATTLKGSQLTWYYADKAVLHPTLVSAACEFFPVLLIVHHFVAGKAHKIAAKLVKKDMMSSVLQYMALKKIKCLNWADVKTTCRTMAFPAFVAAVQNWMLFAILFLYSGYFKDIMSRENIDWPINTLLSFSLVHIFLPANYLLQFTAGGAWMDVFIRQNYF
uniref:Uncharacterized protein n=1 Tax=Ditylenchus dipsaci TaxID=166011 RepID=A0A915E1A8_9BILA